MPNSFGGKKKKPNQPPHFRLEQRGLPRCCLLLWLLCGPISNVLYVHADALAAERGHATIKAAWVRGEKGSVWRPHFSVPTQSPFWCSAWELSSNAESGSSHPSSSEVCWNIILWKPAVQLPSLTVPSWASAFLGCCPEMLQNCVIRVSNSRELKRNQRRC